MSKTGNCPPVGCRRSFYYLNMIGESNSIEKRISDRGRKNASCLSSWPEYLSLIASNEPFLFTNVSSTNSSPANILNAISFFSQHSSFTDHLFQQTLIIDSITPLSARVQPESKSVNMVFALNGTLANFCIFLV